MSTRPFLFSRSLSTLALVMACTVALGLGACTPRVDSRGTHIDPEDVAPLTVGQSTRAEVLELLGSPSNRSAFKPETWYYISEVTETTAFFAPELKERTVYAIEFDDSGVIKDVRKLDETAAENVEPAEGKTPTAGNQLNIFEQMLSNLGRFNKN